MPHIHFERNNEKNIRLAFLLNITFGIAEIIGGYLTNSIAILSDALHDIGDGISLFLAWRLEKLSAREGDNNFSYGYKRFSLLGALISSVILILGSVYVVSEAVERLRNPQATNVPGMLVFAIIGITVNGYAAYRTHGGANLNEKMISWHMIEDMLGWVAVLIVSIILLFRDVPVLDPLLSLGVTTIILFNVFKNLRKTLNLFLQGVPEVFNVEDFEGKILAMDMVEGVHHTHVWSLDGETDIFTGHIIVEKELLIDPDQTRRTIKEVLREHHIEHSTTELESEDFCSGIECGLSKTEGGGKK